MANEVGNDILENLPLILAGPLLHHTEPESVTVWVALKQPCQVHLTVYATTDNGTRLGAPVMAGQRTTIALGRSLHVVAVTARSEAGDCLSRDRLYAYDLNFTNEQYQTEYTLEQALRSEPFPNITVSYFQHQKPTFALPSCPQDLRIVHGSCRKPHGNGFDALVVLDCLIADAADQPDVRPHQLFLTGDQIYADDVADPLLWIASRLGDWLLGWEEPLPVGNKEPSDVVYYTPQQLPAGKRADVATRQAGFTAGSGNQPLKISSHLLSLGEFYAAYLLAWSPACWVIPFPTGRQALSDRQAIRRWDRDVEAMQQFLHTLWKVQRALANIPTYTIFDDHDVSDDWNLNQAWCLRVYGRPLGRRAVQNALLAYAVFQAWGNTPQRFEAGQAGAALLAAAQAWSDSKGTDWEAYDRIARYVGMPIADPHTGLPEFIQDGSVYVLKRHPEAIPWHYTLQSQCHEVIVLDTRTWRGYPVEEKAIAPPELLCPQAFQQQLLHPLQQTADAQIPITFVIASTNLFQLKVIDWIHHWQLRRNNVFSTDVGDAWNINDKALAKFLSTLFQQRNQVIILSGDIHYSSMVRLSHTGTLPDSSEPDSVLLQLTASALKNEEPKTQIIHTRLKQWLLPEPVRQWAGWTSPPAMVELSRGRFQRYSQTPSAPSPSAPPEWLCSLEWIPRQPSQTANWGRGLPWLLSSTAQKKMDRWRWLQPLKFWRTRWFQDGHEVVGLNNLALIQLAETEVAHGPKIIQDLYWFSSWSPIQIVYSRYESLCSPNQPPPEHRSELTS